MNLQNDSNKFNSSIQEVLNNWDNKILPHLPQQMDDLARRTGAFQRKRGVCSAMGLLKILFLYASSRLSFRILAIAACALGLSAISGTAWRKRFSKAAPFLREILHSLLSPLLPPVDIPAFAGVKNVLLVDAEKRKMEWVDVFGFCKYKGKTGFVRAIAHKLTDAQAAKARKRKTTKASKNQRQIGAETLFCAGWATVVTSLGAEYCGEELLHLYKSRWQVELLFKRFKQDFSIHTIKDGSSGYAETETLLWLIIWTIAERETFQAECFLVQKWETSYSTYEECKISFIQITDVLRLSWSHFVGLTDKKYMRYLINYFGVRIGSKFLADIRQLHVQTAIADMLEAGRTSKSVREATGILQNCVEAVIANGLMSINPVVGVIVPKCEKVERRVLSVEEQEIFFRLSCEDKKLV